MTEARARQSGRARRARWLAALAGAAALVGPACRGGGEPAPSLAHQLGPTRAIEARLGYPGSERHRPLDVPRGARTSEPISLETKIRLERAGDWHGLAVASLLAGERERAAQAFARATATPRVLADRAALELLDGGPEALERALDDVDRALAAAPGDPPALWNRALVLAALELPLAAARQLDEVAALGEPGWADEARLRARTLRAPVGERQRRWKRAYDAGRRLIEDGTPVPPELAGVTGIMTITLYDAVRAAPSRAAVEALLPLAQALDAAYRSDRLAGYVRRIAAAEFAARKPLADAYRPLALRRPLAAGAGEAMLARFARAGADDLRLGALVYTGRVAAELADYRRLAAATGDPWFAVIAQHEAATASLARGDTIAGERQLRDALALARRERLAYRAILLEDALATLHREALDLAAAARAAHAGFREAAAAGEWVLEMNALSELAAIHQNRYANGPTRAYLEELLERSELVSGADASPYDCARRNYVRYSLANIWLQRLEPDRARAEVERAVAARCADGADLLKALVHAELYRHERRADDATRARAYIAELRAGALPAGFPALLGYLEGGVLLEQDRAAGRRALREAITTAGRNRAELDVKARAYSLALLALDAGRAGELAEVIAVVGETVGVRPPDRCTLAIAVQDDHGVIAFRDAAGAIGGQLIAARRAPELDAAALVPPAIVQRLRGCERIGVLARAPVLGLGRVLPGDLAWSYLLPGGAAAPGATAGAGTAGRRVVIANPLAPADLRLPPLGPLPDEPSEPGAVTLRGPDATPTRVLDAIRDASVIEFHTHGFLGNDLVEASYLVLSPELDRRHALTAGDVAALRLTGAPLVLLGACHAARSSRTLEGGIGLAEAFLRAGARAVIASPDAVPDRGGHQFFAAVRERVRGGADPVIAVRDERARLRSPSPGSPSHDDDWISGVVVFESFPASIAEMEHSQ